MVTASTQNDFLTNINGCLFWK